MAARARTLYLGLDTATPYLSLALWSAAVGVTESVATHVGRAHAEQLLPALAKLLERAGVQPADIAGIGVGVGPGSYTGLRVGLATAQGLARGWGVPLAGGSTLGALAATGLAAGERGVAALDARRGMVYAGLYHREVSDIVELEPPRKTPRDALERAYPGWRWLEHLPPDAAFLAAQAARGAPAEAVYL